MIQVWAAFLPEGALPLPEDMPEVRRARCSRLMREGDRSRAAASHRLLRLGLDTFAGRRVSLDSWEEDAYGKPFLRAEPRLHFSIAHSEKLVLCALADSPIGGDAEALRDIPPRLLRKFACPGEMVALEAAGSRAEDALSLWTRKESYGKYLGVGIGQPRVFQAFLWQQPRTPPPESAYLTELSLPEGYFGAVCCREPLTEPLRWAQLET